MPPRTSGLLKALLFTVIIAAIVPVAACGQPSPTPAAGTPTPAGTAAAPAVTISNFSFSPADVTVSAGTTVTWTNKDAIPHEVNSSGSTPFDSGLMQQNATFNFTFSSAGAYPYNCAIHPYMKGTVTVQ